MTQVLGRLAQALSGDLLRFEPEVFLEPAGEPAIVGPDSVSWRVFGNPLSLAVGGIAAVLLELGEPRVRAGVWDHSSFRRDPRERIGRTGLGALITVFAAESRFESYAARVNRIHAQITGVSPDGQAYRADAPELLLWVQSTAAYAFVEAYSRLVQPLGGEDKDRFYEEAALGARAYGVLQPPRSRADMRTVFAAVEPTLGPSPVIGEFLHIMRSAPVLPRALLPLQRLLVRAAVDLVPEPLRVRIGIAEERRPNAVERRLLKAAARAAEWVRLPNDPRRLAHERLIRGPAASGVQPRS